jgi:hypothetical protein
VSTCAWLATSNVCVLHTTLLDTVQALLMVGEQFDGADNDEVCGAVVQNRQKGDRVAIWTSKATNGEGVMRVG